MSVVSTNMKKRELIIILGSSKENSASLKFKIESMWNENHTKEIYTAIKMLVNKIKVRGSVESFISKAYNALSMKLSEFLKQGIQRLSDRLEIDDEYKVFYAYR